MCAARITTIKADTATQKPADGRNPIAIPKVAYSVKEACEASSMKMSAFYKLLRGGKIRARKMGRRTVILADDLRAYLEGLPAADFTPVNGERLATDEMDRLAAQFEILAKAERVLRDRYAGGEDEIEDEWLAIRSQCDPIAKAIAEAPATTPRHLRLRAQAYMWARMDKLQDMDDELHDVVGVAIARDLLATG